jgi:hypothetical protein
VRGRADAAGGPRRGRYGLVGSRLSTKSQCATGTDESASDSTLTEPGSGHGACLEAVCRSGSGLPRGAHRSRDRGWVQGRAAAPPDRLRGGRRPRGARSGRRGVHQQRGAARAHARLPAGEGAGRRARGGGSAAGGARDLRDQPVQSSSRCSPRCGASPSSRPPRWRLRGGPGPPCSSLPGRGLGRWP